MRVCLYMRMCEAAITFMRCEDEAVEKQPLTTPLTPCDENGDSNALDHSGRTHDTLTLHNFDALDTLTRFTTLDALHTYIATVGHNATLVCACQTASEGGDI